MGGNFEDITLDDLIEEQWSLGDPSPQGGEIDLYYYGENVGTLDRDHAPIILLALRQFE